MQSVAKGKVFDVAVVGAGVVGSVFASILGMLYKSSLKMVHFFFTYETKSLQLHPPQREIFE
jgi:hypothetical protein